MVWVSLVVSNGTKGVSDSALGGVTGSHLMIWGMANKQNIEYKYYVVYLALVGTGAEATLRSLAAWFFRRSKTRLAWTTVLSQRSLASSHLPAHTSRETTVVARVVIQAVAHALRSVEHLSEV